MVLVRTNLTLPEELMAQVDALAGPRGRSAFVAEAVVARVKRERLRAALDGARGVYRGTSFEMTADEAYQWVREQRRDDPDNGT